MTRTLYGGLGAAAMLLVASCSASTTNFPAKARESIDRYGQASGFGALNSQCDKPPSDEVGTDFDCTATTSDGTTIRFHAEIGDSKQVAVQPTNVLTVDNLTEIESEAARILSEKVGQDLPAEAIDCGQQAIVAKVGEPIVCALSNPSNPTVVYDTSITLDDLTKPTHFEIAVAPTPRP